MSETETEKKRVPDAVAASIAALDTKSLRAQLDSTKQATRTVTVDVDPLLTTFTIRMADAQTPADRGGPGALYVNGSSNAGNLPSMPLGDLATPEEAAAIESFLQRVALFCAQGGV